MSIESDKFEKKVARIKEVLEGGSSVITWNDNIIDPDNPVQNRQIDITIKREDTYTHVECRLHKNPQNVKWIEELIGRKISLGADSMIGVSNSGFTSGAILKAEKHGVILRDFSELTEEEISAWGKTTEIEIILLNISNIKLIKRI